MKIRLYLKAKSILKNIIPKNIWLNLRTLFPSEKVNQKIRRQAAFEWKKEKERISSTIEKNIPFGVNLIGYFRAANGLGEAARSNLKLIQLTNIPFSVHDFEEDVPDHQQFDFPINSYCNEFKYNINLIHINPMQFPYLWNHFSHKDLTDRYNIGVWYWELPEFPDDWCDTFSLVDEVWVASEFVKESISKKTSKPVFIIPPSIEVNYDESLKRDYFGLPKDAFLFLVAYDVLSVQKRKNPEGAIKAFKSAFSPNDSSVGLVIKINNASENNSHLYRLKKELDRWNNVYFIDEIFPKEIFNALLSNINVYVSLHRSEGFGLIPAEAMYLGKAVVMTNWSGNIDFVELDNCCPVNYKIIPVGKNAGIYNQNCYWAEPDYSHAAQLLTTLYADHKYFTKIGKNAQKTIKRKYSPQRIKEIIQVRLKKLKNNL